MRLLYRCPGRKDAVEARGGAAGALSLSFRRLPESLPGVPQPWKQWIPAAVQGRCRGARHKSPNAAMTGQSSPKAVEAVLDIARWAPSGDNAQPWRFRIMGDRQVEVLVRRSNANVYEYRQGEPTLVSAGALLANIALAAPAFGLQARWHYAGSSDGIDRILVDFSDDPAASAPVLFDQIARRSVDRRPVRMQPLTAEQKDLLAAELNPGMQVQWVESLPDRWKMAGLSALATNIRLTIPETFAIHRDIVDWNNRESEHAIPSSALGLDPLTLRLTRWSLAEWRRTSFMN